MTSNTSINGPLLSIVIGTYNRCDQIRRAIESIVATTSIGYCLYVTDAGSTDGTIAYLESVRSDTIVPILVGKRLGQAAAYNQVFEQVTTPYVCWLSDDNEVVGDGLGKAVRILTQDSRVGMVGLKVRDVQGPFCSAPYIGGLSKFGILNVNQGVLPTKVLREVGYFSEAFRDYGIDPDLTAKVLLAGYDIVFTRDVAIHHFRNWETDPSSPDYAKMQDRQRAYLALYDKTYAAHFPNGARQIVRRGVWKAIRALTGLSLDSHAKVLGLNARDWQNGIIGRHIDLIHELRNQHADYHLRQHAPLRKR
ncbi:glycosyl transferase family 2 [Bosea sp. AAP35]|uniref:glycosyltransferase family 2 protein n=1 Tax=Bosea sp. AAP35 TaxID=1523417 RepID=UPI0006B99085|nr:glycosyltransferase [Bosea sp. AAP35]KPF66599.1 glycosyl transferase family 2 [Bosea sp. AAP35]